MRDVHRWPAEAWVPLLGGLAWLWQAPGHGLLGGLLSVVPGCLLLGSGVSMLLMPGDRRIAQFAAAGAALGVVFALPAAFAMGIGAGLLLAGISAAAFLAAGVHSLRVEAPHDGVPVPVPSLALAAQVAADEMLLAELVTAIRPPTRDDHARVEREVSSARDRFAAEGWLEKPERYHREPPPLVEPRIDRRRVRGLVYEHLHFDSGYEPHPDEPGRERWLTYAANRTAHAWVVRHAGGERPWLLCVHGYVMGAPLIDFAVFRPGYFHEKLGMNVILPTLPLHGRRSIGRRSGEGFFRADILDMIHAEAQAMWDMRRCLDWVRQQTSAPVGVYGLSLGGYNAALLASLDPELACVIAGVPVADFTRLLVRHAPPPSFRTLRDVGLSEERIREVARVISPLDMAPKVPQERRYLFGGIADRIVPADQVRDLWRHWEEPRIVWYPGGHVTFRAHRAVNRLVDDALHESGLAV